MYVYVSQSKASYRNLYQQPHIMFESHVIRERNIPRVVNRATSNQLNANILFKS